MRVNGVALSELRKRSGLRPSALAHEAGISPSYLSDMEAGRKPGSPDVIKRLAEALKVPLPAILQDPEKVA